jgi:hypothetical protein
MATIDDLRSLLANKSIEAEAVGDGSLYLVTGRARFLLSQAELDAYFTVRSACRLAPETALIGHGMFEQVVNMRLAPYSAARLFITRDEDELSVVRQDGAVRIELSPPSALFILAVLDKSTPEEWKALRRYGVMMGRLGEGDHPIRELLGRQLTVKVVPGKEVNLNTESLHSLAQSAVFNISYARGVALNLQRSWERPFFRLGARREREVAFPLRKYNRDLVAYYQLALSNESPILAYLSLYKIVEFFYVSTAEKVLHRRLSDRIAVPTFSAKKTRDLRDIADLVRRFDKKMNEPQMLANVLAHYLMPDEIKNWVEEFEANDPPHFTEPREILGETLQLTLHEDQVFPSLAQRIYHVRNALVHNKEGDLPRFVPFSGQEELLSKETPLLLFVAEQIIIKSGEDFSA